MPTGLDVAKNRVFITLAGPNPHVPETGKILTLRRGSDPVEIASGARMLIDVERGLAASCTACRRGSGTVWARVRRPHRTPADW